VEVNIENKDGKKVILIKKIVDGKEMVKEFRGEKAEEFMKKHGAKNHKMMFLSEKGKHNIDMEVDYDSVNCISSDDTIGVEKKLKVEIKDGVKKVTVTTSEIGKEKVEVYEGDDATEFLKNENDENIIISS